MILRRAEQNQVVFAVKALQLCTALSSASEVLCSPCKPGLKTVDLSRVSNHTRSRTPRRRRRSRPPAATSAPSCALCASRQAAVSSLSGLYTVWISFFASFSWFFDCSPAFFEHFTVSAEKQVGTSSAIDSSESQSPAVLTVSPWKQCISLEELTRHYQCGG